MVHLPASGRRCTRPFRSPKPSRHPTANSGAASDPTAAAGASLHRRRRPEALATPSRVPTANPKPLTATANRLILAADERSLQVDLVRLDRTVQVAGCVGSRDPGPSTPTQRAAAQIPEAIGV